VPVVRDDDEVTWANLFGGGGYKYGDPALQVGGFSKLKQRNMVMIAAELGHGNDSAGEDKKKLQTIDPSSRQTGRLYKQTHNCLTAIKARHEFHICV
jgi:hypothetical protein